MFPILSHTLAFSFSLYPSVLYSADSCPSTNHHQSHDTGGDFINNLWNIISLSISDLSCSVKNSSSDILLFFSFTPYSYLSKSHLKPSLPTASYKLMEYLFLSSNSSQCLLFTCFIYSVYFLYSFLLCYIAFLNLLLPVFLTLLFL